MSILNTLSNEIAQINLVRLLERKAKNKDCCIYCGRKFEDSNLRTRKTRDHLIPKERFKGQPPSFRQQFYQFLTVWACSRCNYLKGNYSLTEFYEYIKRRGLPEKQLTHIKELIKPS